MRKLSKEIKKKTWPEYFEKILSGETKIEVRLADFDIETGDILILEEYDPETKSYTGRTVRKKASFVENTKEMEEFHPKEDIEKFGINIIQLEDENRD